METPICDFVEKYNNRDILRLHMPGHKGIGPLGIEALDITEISGADSLYDAQGIIAQSEKNAGELFGCPTFYSTEGSSHCIRAMLYLSSLQAKQAGRMPVIAAARNVHKAFLSAAALLDFSVQWLYSDREDTVLSCILTPENLERQLAEMELPPAAVYITSPDYLGNVADIAALARVCHRRGCLLLVDNAHGAYLRFLPKSQHPMDLGADLCCDSAHKTLPVLTGGAYLHIAKDAPELFLENVRDALAIFGSTSPSYLILQSLDNVNRLLDGGYQAQLEAFIPKVQACRSRLAQQGYALVGDEPLKLTVSPKPYGYTGEQLAQHLRWQGIECEFSDPDFLVLLLQPQMGTEALGQLEEALCRLPRQQALEVSFPRLPRGKKILSIREAALLPRERISVQHCVGRILADPSVACPPAVPIGVCGEQLNEAAQACFAYYGITCCKVVKEGEG